jgi:hypothetical protein
MKTISPHPLRLVTARDRQQPRHAREMMMKGRVETGDLRQIGKTVMKRLGQQNLLRQMLRIKRSKRPKLRHHFRRDPLRRAILRSAMHHAMSHRGQWMTPAAFVGPIHQGSHRRLVIRRLDRSREGISLVQSLRMPGGIRQSNSLNPSSQDPFERARNIEQRKLDAR